VSTSLSASHGLLIRDRAAFERARNLQAVVFDKTGTLTEGRFGVSDVVPLGELAEEECLRLAAALEGQSQHPIAKGVTRAAAKLNRVQSNVTTRIKQLEEQLGTELFIRDGRRLVLTPAGETLLPYAERLLALADEARNAVRENRPSGRLRLGTMESVAASRLPGLLARYHQRWPDVALELETGTTGRLIERVREFEVDAALIATPPNSTRSHASGMNNESTMIGTPMKCVALLRAS